MTDAPPVTRLDKWLWAVRLYKTRTLAAEACRLLRVRCGGQEVKSSRPVRVGDVYEIQQEALTRSVRVVALLEKRVAGKFAERYVEDLTPPEVLAAARARREELRLSPPIAPDYRPSRKDRELLRKLYEPEEAEEA